MGRLLLTAEQAAALAGVEPKEILIAYRAGEIPRWRLPGKRDPFFNVRDIEAAFDCSIAEHLGKV